MLPIGDRPVTGRREVWWRFASRGCRGGSLGGTLLRDRADFSLSINGSNNWATPQIYLNTGAGRRAENAAVRQPSVMTSASALINYALTKDQTIRFGLNVSDSDRRNQGVGDQSDFERGYSTESRGWGVRFQETGPLGRRFVTNTRFTMNMNRSEQTSVLEAPTIIVPEEFTSGGAQRKGGTFNRSFAFQQDLDYVRGLHSFRAGLMMDGGYARTSTFTNYLGTYTFESLEAFTEGRPRSYSRRIGDPSFDYWNVQTALYIQDDIRPRKNVSVSLGLRYETQMRVDEMDAAFHETWGTPGPVLRACSRWPEREGCGQECMVQITPRRRETQV